MIPPDLSPYVYDASEKSCIITIMEGKSMQKTEYHMKAIMYPAYGTHLGLYSISLIDHLLIRVLFVTAYCTVFIART